MRKAKIGIVSLLILTMILSMLPITALATYSVDEDVTTVTEQVSQPALRSMMPLKEERVSINLEGLLRSELESYATSNLVAKINEKITNEAHKINLNENEAVWAKWSYQDADGNYVNKSDDFVRLGDTTDLADYSDYNTGIRAELIVGKVDQLNLNNLRYIVEIQTTALNDMFTVTLANKARETMDVFATYIYQTTGGDRRMQVNVDKADWTGDEENYISLALDESFAGVDAKVYEGYYESEAALSTAKDITSDIWGTAPTSSGYCGNFSYGGNTKITVVLKRSGTTVAVLPMILCAYETEAFSLSGNSLYAVSSENNNRTYVKDYSRSDYSLGYENVEVQLRNGYPANGNYYLSLRMHNYRDDTYGIGNVKKAVVGDFDAESKIPPNAVDIKDQLFSEAYYNGGYAADYSGGVTFTVVDVEGGIHRIRITTKEGTEEVPEPTTASEDTYFRIQGAGIKGEYLDWYSCYVMPYDADSYYFNGYQTLFMLNTEYNDGNRVYSPVSSPKIVPIFDVGNGVQIFAGANGASATKQISEETEIDFTSGKAVQYSAAAENGKNLKNYWVTFLTQQEGPKLFVNAVNDESHYATVDGQKMPQREVFLNEEYGHHHDVFFANIGDQSIEGLYVKLENAQNVKLDDYWTVGDTTTLSAFTTTERRDPDGNYVHNGDLANFAKVRLVPENDELGVISGTLVIGYTGDGTTSGEEVRINLAGIAGDPMITTTSVVDGVKFVPYSSVIQTNSLHGGMAFSVTEGALPDGLTLKPNGEIYGIPTKPGEYEFTVKAVYNKNEKAACEQTYVLTIQDNTDENVLAVNEGEQGYKLLDAVDKNLSIADIPAAGVLFRSEGTFGDFVAFFLDGKKLVKGTDYDADEGSTRITIRAQTFKNAGNGTHTIAAEFRAGGQADGEMKKTAQNVTVTGSSNSGGGGSSGGNYESSNVTTGATTLDVVTAEAKRIANGNMNYVTEIRVGAIKEALAQGHGITVSVEPRIISRGEVPSDDLTLIDKRLGNIGSTNMFLEILVAVRDGTTGELLGYVTQTSSKMQFTIDVPQYMLDAQKQGKYIYVMRVHAGKAEFLSTSIKDGKATFSANKFSTYTLVLMDRAVFGARTGDVGIMTYTISASIALAGVGVLTMKRRKRCCEREQ